MTGLAVLRFKLMLAWGFIIRIFLPYGTGNNLAAKTIPLLHPTLGRQKKAFITGLDKTFSDGKISARSWKRHKALVGINRFQSSYYSQPDITWIEKCELEITGEEIIEQLYGDGKGILVMTYHHHLNMLFCNMLARLGHPVSTIAMDDREKSKFKKFAKRVQRIHEHAEKLVNGGELILVKPRKQVRAILRAFGENHLVVTANDFPEIFEDKNRKDFSFFNSSLSCPTGTVKLAMKKNIPVVAAYLDWLGGSRFKLVIKPVSDGKEDMQVEDAMTRYLAVLESAIQNQPGIWEGWKWIS